MDLLELRRIIEPACAQMAAERSNSEDFAEIERALAEMERSVGKTALAVEADLRFHLAILEATHNSFMRSFGTLIQAALRASFRLTSQDMAAYQLSLRKHRAVLTAIRNRSPKRAEAAMRAVLEGTHQGILRAIERKDNLSGQGPR
jgi:DNA-binding FadR family transcriptional regulator